MDEPFRPADAVAQTWVDRVPFALQPYLRLMRLDRPIGTWLLFWPCVFGLALGGAAAGHGFDSWRDAGLIALFAIGSIVMRGAGCTYNDVVDRDIDAQVARTRGRPIPSGAVSAKQAAVFLAAQCAVGLAILLQLNVFSIVLGASSLILVAIYPFMKRVTWWPQAWLGLTFNWGALLGFSAEAGHLALPAYILYAACFFWTLGYDTIYALQDVEDDALIGVKSTARLFGAASRRWVAGFYLVCFALLQAAGFAAGLGWLFAALTLAAGAHFAWQVLALRTDDPARCLQLFRANRDAGLLMAAAFVLSCARL
ncbi:MAG TPA: 4-hydroxybenzoate octaprenyltransferase [Rhizomicrobium sp.]|jgi:4-hydroxybenzoate polyprenyltransferase|nr:4-hydroxybenzoate octaprenyltransferase [Rhizomicrobium sp.]